MSAFLDIHKDYKCAPSVFHTKKNIYNTTATARNRFASCYRPEDLIAMIKSFNRAHKPKIKLPRNPTSRGLWKLLDQRLRRVCTQGDEQCWSRQNFAKALPKTNREWVERFTFKPPLPIDERTKNVRDAWLSNFDVEGVMEQYEKVYPNFVFLGPYPIDFAKYYSHYGFSAKKIGELLRRGIHQIGIIFNTGTLKSGGMHWVSLFIDFTPMRGGTGGFGCNIEYFDSVGDSPPAIIRALITKIKNVCEQSEKFCINVHEHTRQLRHQRGNNECGVYCLYFITERLKGRGYAEIQANLIPDGVMNKFRIKFFRSRD